LNNGSSNAFNQYCLSSLNEFVGLLLTNGLEFKNVIQLLDFKNQMGVLAIFKVQKLSHNRFSQDFYQ